MEQIIKLDRAHALVSFFLPVFPLHNFKIYFCCRWVSPGLLRDDFVPAGVLLDHEASEMKVVTSVWKAWATGLWATLQAPIFTYLIMH